MSATEPPIGVVEEYLDENEIKEPYSKSAWQPDTNQVPPSDIVTYNEIRSCYELFRLTSTGQIILNPDFQRDLVWQPARQTRFIDSLLKKLPIPSICLAYDYTTEKMIVIDGLQRLSTLKNLMSPDSEFQLADLEDVDKRLQKKSSASLRRQVEVISKIENSSIPVTMLRCDMSREDHREYIFTIFHRLNTGGMALNNQEIRNCIFQGALNDLLHELDCNADWLRFIGNNKRFRGQEQLLRFFAFSYNVQNYDGKLSKFLNAFMGENKEMSKSKSEQMKNYFLATVSVLRGLNNDYRSLVVREAFLFAVGRNITKISEDKAFDPNEAIEAVLKIDDFKPEVIAEGIAQKNKLISRLVNSAAEVRKYVESHY